MHYFSVAVIRHFMRAVYGLKTLSVFMVQEAKVQDGMEAWK